MSESGMSGLNGVLNDCQHWRMEIADDGIGWLCLDKSGASTNVLSHDVLTEFERIVDALRTETPDGLILYSGKDGNFIAGADIKEFPKIESESDAYALMRRGHKMLAQLEALPCNTVAVINGFALGGGLELALACDWRIAIGEDRPTLGLPEVQLGLHPGFGGTVRLVNLVGVSQAMPLMLTGKSITPLRARKIGLVDSLTTAENWRKDARSHVRRLPPKRRPGIADRLLNLSLLRPLVARRMYATVARRAKKDHYPAPYAIVDLWRKYGAKATVAYDAEARSFAELVQSPTSRNLVRVYFLQERLKHTANTGSTSAKIGHVHVVGAGVMGGDIAAWCALRGFPVTLQDRDMQYIQPALDRAEQLFDRRLSDADNIAAARGRLVADVTGEGISGADIVIEAVFEDRDVKRALYEQLEPRMKRDAVLATNTSSIPLEELAPCLRYPDRLIGLHFFNPVAKLPLVEVVKAELSGTVATAKGLSFAREIGKLPLPCSSHPGFLVNRILAPYMAEAMEMIREGIPLAEIDQAAVNFGMPMGPVELVDSVGVDVALHVAHILSPVVNRPVAPELEAMVTAGRLGQKTGHGFYLYRDGKPIRPHESNGVATEEIQERLILAMVNEAAACLADKVVDDAELVDAGVIFGTGFAPFRGGPMHYAQTRGVDDIVTALEALTAKYGPRFKPSPGWAELRQ
jgi:3-hydroxyacyl-CoA dehydrogenase/enoyl-CoA hydratase/3-hydroxybutyryl-CoA epimerase